MESQKFQDILPINIDGEGKIAALSCETTPYLPAKYKLVPCFSSKRRHTSKLKRRKGMELSMGEMEGI
jgi:hypothetical protein